MSGVNAAMAGFRRARCAGALGLSAILVAVLALPSAQAASSPSATSWPEPGANAEPSQPLSIGGRSGSVQLVRKPLVLLEEDVEQGPQRSFSINTDVLFATGEHTLSPEAGEALDQLAAQLQKSELSGPASVIGHTDDVGSDADNLALSKRRASTVAARLKPLMEGTGIALTAKGLGESQPLAKGTDERSRARNRRVSVVFSAKTAAVPRERDWRDYSVPVSQPAAAASVGSAPEDSIVATQRTITFDEEGEYRYTVRLDVTRAEVLGKLIVIGVQVEPVSGPSGDFTRTRELFTGGSASSSPAIYDRAAARRLPPVVNGEGLELISNLDNWIGVGDSTLGWMMFPVPEDLGESVELYIPAFGVLNVPVKQ